MPRATCNPRGVSLLFMIKKLNKIMLLELRQPVRAKRNSAKFKIRQNTFIKQPDIVQLIKILIVSIL